MNQDPDDAMDVERADKLIEKAELREKVRQLEKELTDARYALQQRDEQLRKALEELGALKVQCWCSGTIRGHPDCPVHGRANKERISVLENELYALQSACAAKDAALRFYTQAKHEGECVFSDKCDEGCYLCSKAENEHYPKVLKALSPTAGTDYVKEMDALKARLREAEDLLTYACEHIIEPVLVQGDCTCDVPAGETPCATCASVHFKYASEAWLKEK